MCLQPQVLSLFQFQLLKGYRDLYRGFCMLYIYIYIHICTYILLDEGVLVCWGIAPALKDLDASEGILAGV